MPKRCLTRLQDIHEPRRIGHKAENLRFLAKKGFPTPATYVCTWDSYDAYAHGDRQVLDLLRAELAAELDPNRRYAVRSSANLEDGTHSSFAGQFKSVLDVQGAGEILEAIGSVWASVQSPTVQAYLERSGLSARDLRMAVIVQEMVSPQVSGVAFSKNPVTGLDEVVVEAVRGSGEALLQDGVTPDRWINKWGTWISKPSEPGDGQGIELGVIELVVRKTKEIARAYGHPVDLEWVYDGSEVKWIQLRQITSLDIPIYSNRIAKEVFPGLIKPLIWSVNVPLVNGAWIRLLTEVIGHNDLKPEDLAAYFYHRAYFNMGTLGRIFERMGLPSETLELLLGISRDMPDRPSFRPTTRTYRLLPRMLAAAWDKIRFGRKVEAFLRSMGDRYRGFLRGDLSVLSERELLAEIDRLYPLTQEGAYYNVVTLLLALLYNRLLGERLAEIGVDFQSFDLVGGIDELRRFEPTWHLARLSRAFGALSPAEQDAVRQSTYEEFLEVPGIAPFQRLVASFLDDFGHLSDSGNDFSHKPWRETPELILHMIADQGVGESGGAKKIGFTDLAVSGLRRWRLRLLYRRARAFVVYREAVSSLYTYGYGLFRELYLALGERFVQRDIIDSKDEIFYLFTGEVREIVKAGHQASDARALVQERKGEMGRVRALTPPDTIFGEKAPPLEPSQGEELLGVPTSRGHYTGPARILQGIGDFSKVQDGDVLVIPYSDVGWTPLFAKAGAVVAESGGMLSHSSIIAREYGIPAVVSVAGACQIEEGKMVSVDGYRGTIKAL
ncbi:MAG: PEP/pyruvate-binding domain-containing protein [Anaerolineae bacterium]|jgi:pyruvate,water dikinase